MIHHHEKTHYAFSFMQCAIAEELLKNLIVVACNCAAAAAAVFIATPNNVSRQVKANLKLWQGFFKELKAISKPFIVPAAIWLIKGFSVVGGLLIRTGTTHSCSLRGFVAAILKRQLELLDLSCQALFINTWVFLPASYIPPRISMILFTHQEICIAVPHALIVETKGRWRSQVSSQRCCFRKYHNTAVFLIHIFILTNRPRRSCTCTRIEYAKYTLYFCVLCKCARTNVK